MGNDIVDLWSSSAIGKSGDKKFVHRILCPEEQKILSQSKCPDNILWGFWAAKETAFKAISKTDPDISSSPRRYPVLWDACKASDPCIGIVVTPNGDVRVKLVYHKDYVHCIGIVEQEVSFDDITWGVKKIDDGDFCADIVPSEHESFMVRKLAIEHIAARLYCHPADVHIIRPGATGKLGPPCVVFKGRKENVDISLSHDGRFVAYAFLMGYQIQAGNI